MCSSIFSGASFALISVMNKVLTVIVNCVMWDKHASQAGIISLLVCLAGGFLYQQAPLVTDVYEANANAVYPQVQVAEGEGVALLTPDSKTLPSKSSQEMALSEEGQEGAVR